MSLDKTDIVKWPSPHLPRLDDSMLGTGAQWEDDSDKCQCEWPGPGSLVSPSLVPCDGGSNQLVCGAAWCSVTWHTVDTPHHSLYLSPVAHQHSASKGQDAVGNMCSPSVTK